MGVGCGWTRGVIPTAEWWRALNKFNELEGAIFPRRAWAAAKLHMALSATALKRT